MKRISMLLIALSTAACLNAQLTQRFVVKAGDNVAEVISPNGFYRLPQFAEGVFTLKSGLKSRALFNYHIGNGEIEYINQKGDTMAIGVPDDIVNITISDNVQYIYSNKSYVEILGVAESARLGKKIRVILENDKKGGYGESAPASNQVSMRNFSLGSGIFHLNHDIAIVKSTSYYWVDPNNNLQPVTKKSSIKLVAKDKQSKLEAFIDENKINFNNEDDLRKLLLFSDTL